MKKYALILGFMGFLPTAFAQNNEEESIKKLLVLEGASWRFGDITTHANCWQIRPYSSILISQPSGSMMELDPQIMLNPPKAFVGNGGFSVHSNFNFSLSNDKAWVKHDEVSIDKYGVRSLSKEIRFLEKIQNQWKLIGQSIHGYQDETSTKDTVSYIHTVDITNHEIDVVASLKGHFEAPNWHPDNYLILNSKGKLYTFDFKNKVPQLLNTGSVVHNNNDHGISPDKKWLAISAHDPNFPSPKSYKSTIYVLPIGGGQPKRITSDVPSYWHGWSPDGKTLAYCAERNNNYDVYTINLIGGIEKKLTNSEGLDDGPDYSPDGKYIYFNSYRTGHMQIWRMLADGSQPEQLTFDDNSNWFAHPSPDNKWIVYISYVSDEKQNHPFGKQVKLRLMHLETKEIRDITPVFFGGQGTINVPSWSPDSKKIAFVSYSINQKKL